MNARDRGGWQPPPTPAVDRYGILAEEARLRMGTRSARLYELANGRRRRPHLGSIGESDCCPDALDLVVPEGALLQVLQQCRRAIVRRLGVPAFHMFGAIEGEVVVPDAARPITLHRPGAPPRVYTVPRLHHPSDSDARDGPSIARSPLKASSSGQAGWKGGVENRGGRTPQRAWLRGLSQSQRLRRK